MTDAERLTISLTDEIATMIREAVEAGDYASADDVVRSALQDWTTRRARSHQADVTLEADIAIGLADVAAGRVMDFDTARIIERGRALSARR